LPNVKYEVVYLLDKPQADRKIYRYKLQKENSAIKTSDGVIVIEALDKNKVRFIEYDFVDAYWGIVKTMAPSRIWKDSVESFFLSDIAIKLKAENPTWTNEKTVDEAKEALKTFPIDKVLKER